MLGWALVFYIVAMTAAVFGFTEMAPAWAGLAKSLFLIFLILAVIALALDREKRRRA